MYQVRLEFKEDCDMCLVGVKDHETAENEFRGQQGVLYRSAKRSDQHCQIIFFHDNSSLNISKALQDLQRKSFSISGIRKAET